MQTVIEVTQEDLYRGWEHKKSHQSYYSKNCAIANALKRRFQDVQVQSNYIKADDHFFAVTPLLSKWIRQFDLFMNVQPFVLKLDDSGDILDCLPFPPDNCFGKPGRAELLTPNSLAPKPAAAPESFATATWVANVSSSPIING